MYPDNLTAWGFDGFPGVLSVPLAGGPSTIVLVGSPGLVT